MSFYGIAKAAALGLAVSGGLAGAAMADGLKPVQSRGIDLGSVAGDAYYTVAPDGFHVVATFAQRDGSGSPMRVQAVLAAGQSVTFSAPRGWGVQPVSVVIRRAGERVVVDQAALTE